MVKKLWLNFTQQEKHGFGCEYAPLRKKLLLAGLSEAKLRKMPPDARVAALAKAKLHPPDYLFLAC